MDDHEIDAGFTVVSRKKRLGKSTSQYSDPVALSSSDASVALAHKTFSNLSAEPAVIPSTELEIAHTASEGELPDRGTESEIAQICSKEADTEVPCKATSSSVASATVLPELIMKPYSWYGHLIDPNQNPLCFVWFFCLYIDNAVLVVCILLFVL